MMGVCGLRVWILGLFFWVTGVCGLGAGVGVGPFAIEVLDGATSRGIPLVVLETTYGGVYVTDSNGLVAFDEPLAMGRDVFFRPRSHGYEFDGPPLAMGGVSLRVEGGTTGTIVMRRRMIAERLYRITGAGIYRDSVALGLVAPIREPLLNGGVIGQDSALTTVFGGRVFWVWGDTTPLRHPLGNFRVTGAWSDLPTSGGVAVDRGVDLEYIIGDERAGFVKSMVPRHAGDESNVYWLSCLMTVLDASGRERMLGWVSNVDGGSMETLNRRIMEFDRVREEFVAVADWPTSAAVQPGGHAVRVRLPVDLDSLEGGVLRPDDLGGGFEDYYVFTSYDEQVRVRATYEAAKDPGQYTTVPLRMRPFDVESGEAIKLHGSSIAWNDFRGCWTMIASEIGGSSVLGEMYYLEAPTPMGPWEGAVKVVTHDDYTIYNPLQHPELAEEGSPYLYFEGTYTKMFSGNEVGTPWYDYNQIMFRLDLRDERLRR